MKLLKREHAYGALANDVAKDSHDCSNISPLGSTNLTPLSASGLWDAVIITPIVAAFNLDLKTANAPIRYMTWSRRSPLERSIFAPFCLAMGQGFLTWFENLRFRRRFWSHVAWNATLFQLFVRSPTS